MHISGKMTEKNVEKAIKYGISFLERQLDDIVIPKVKSTILDYIKNNTNKDEAERQIRNLESWYSELKDCIGQVEEYELIIEQITKAYATKNKEVLLKLK